MDIAGIATHSWQQIIGVNHSNCARKCCELETFPQTIILMAWCKTEVNINSNATTKFLKETDVTNGLWAHNLNPINHDDVIKWKHFPSYWPFVRGIHRSPVNSPHKGQWRGALMFSLICVWINGWVNNRQAGDLRRYRAHSDVTVMYLTVRKIISTPFQIWTSKPCVKWFLGGPFTNMV